jgi:nucleoside-diphosphate-sugar epimerase
MAIAYISGNSPIDKEAQYSELYGINFSALRPFLGYGHDGVFPPIIKLFSDLVSLPAVGKPFSIASRGGYRGWIFCPPFDSPTP